MTAATERIADLYMQWSSLQPLPKENRAALWQWTRMRFNQLSNRFN